MQYYCLWCNPVAVVYMCAVHVVIVLCNATAVLCNVVAVFHNANAESCPPQTMVVRLICTWRGRISIEDGSSPPSSPVTLHRGRHHTGMWYVSAAVWTVCHMSVCPCLSVCASVLMHVYLHTYVCTCEVMFDSFVMQVESSGVCIAVMMRMMY